MELEITIGKEAGGLSLPVSFLDPGTHRVPEVDAFGIPYHSELSLDLVFRRVEALIGQGNAGVDFVGAELLRRVKKFPELRAPVEDMSLLVEHPEAMDLLMMFIIPPTDRSTALFTISKPFHFTPVYVSPAMQRMVAAEDASYSFSGNMGDVINRHYVMIGATILKQFYGVEIDVVPTALLTVPDHSSGLNRFFKPSLINDFVEIRPIGELPHLTQDDIHRLLTNVSDCDLWLNLLPSDKFEFHGIQLTHLTEVTEEEALSRLKHRLISRDAILNIERVRELAALIRIHFKDPSIQLGLTAVDYPIEHVVDHEYRIRYNLVSDTVDRLTGQHFAGSIYERAFRSREVIVVEDLRSLPKPGELEKRLLDLNIRSILIAPLLDQDRNVIGMAELGCPEPFGINAFLELKFREIRGLFRTAIERSREHIDNRIEAIMREQYTSLHSSVEWKFTEAAFSILSQVDNNETPISPEISFDDVYPLYGQADIVGSTRIRNAAVYQDLLDNLRAGLFFLTRAMDLVDFPLVQQVIQSINDALKTKPDEFDNGHEIAFGELIQHHISPLVRQLGKQHPDLRELSEQYLERLNPDLGIFARIRVDYERSLTRINKELSDFFTTRDLAMQQTLPHYFEKFMTDGVEYELYVGQSLLKTQQFSSVHLRNLRLSQLIDLADVTRLVDRLSSELAMPLRTAQLIFAYTSPLNIYFRMDEKRFDVHGDYNVRYEVLKKRIDKATIHQGQERLTLAGHISIVYLHENDRAEYLVYLDYLHQAGYIDGEVEDFMLDPLQSVNGLRALRFKVLV